MEGDVHEQLAAAGMRYLNEATLAQDVEHMEEIYQLLAQVRQQWQQHRCRTWGPAGRGGGCAGQCLCEGVECDGP